MTGKQRVLMALNLEQPDRVPFMDMVVPRMQKAIMGTDDFDLVELAHKLNMDAIWYDFFPPVFARKQMQDGMEIVLDGLIKSRKDLSLIQLPDPHDPAFYDGAKKFIEKYGNSDLALCGRIRLGVSSSLLSMGMEGFSYALADDPGFVEEVLHIYAEWCGVVIEHLNGIGFDYYWSCDDIAYKAGPMMSPTTFRELFLPKMRKASQQIKLPWIYHSDGNITPVLDDLLTLGMNAIHPLEPGAMDITEIKAKYGQRVCLVGNIDLHYTLTQGTAEEVEAEVKQRIRDIAPGGGYILSSANSIPHYVKPENLIAMADAVVKYGKYPLDLVLLG